MQLNTNTPIKLYKMQNAYVPGQGQTSTWAEITSTFNAQTVSVFWAEWQSAFGNQVLDAQAVGVSELATIRMPYVPILYEAIRSGSVAIAKNCEPILKDGVPNAGNQNCYMTFGGVDNYKELNQIIEFKVRRYEAK